MRNNKTVIYNVYSMRERDPNYKSKGVSHSFSYSDSDIHQTSRKTVGPSVLTDRNAVGPTISKYISDRMSGKT